MKRGRGLGSRRGNRNSTVQQEQQYQLARGLFGDYFETDQEVQDRMMAAAFLPRFVRSKSKSVNAIVNIAAKTNLFRFLGRVLVTKDTAKDLLLKRLKREQNKFTITREEAAAKFIQKLDARGSALPKTRPNALRRKSGNPRAITQPGSFKRDINMQTIIKGAINTDKKFQKFVVELQTLINTFASLDTRGKISARAPSINIGKSISKK